MDNKTILYGVIGLLLGVIITWAVSANAVNSQNLGMMRMMGMRGQNGIGSLQDNATGMMGNIDRHFIEQMVPHHDDAIAMAKIALGKAQHPEIKTLAENIISSQTAENEKMKAWYKQWFGRDLPAGEANGQGAMMFGRMGMMGNSTNLTNLENSQDFDKAFIGEMVPHHQMAVMMATMLKGGTNRPEMKQLADDIITAQNSEIGQMRQWYKDWGYQE